MSNNVAPLIQRAPRDNIEPEEGIPEPGFLGLIYGFNIEFGSRYLGGAGEWRWRTPKFETLTVLLNKNKKVISLKFINIFLGRLKTNKSE